MDPLYSSPNFGNSGGKREFISLEARGILVESILSRATALATQAELREIGVKRSVTAVMSWMRQTRRWMGLPPYYPSKISERYRLAVAEWIAKNGRPSRREIMAGWLPGPSNPQPQ